MVGKIKKDIDNVEFSEMLISQILHDFSGIICAISNASELLNDENNSFRKQASEIIRQSADDGIGKINIFRKIYDFSDGYIAAKDYFADVTAIFKRRNVTFSIVDNSKGNACDVKILRPFFGLLFWVSCFAAGKDSIQIIVEDGSLILNAEIARKNKIYESIFGNMNKTVNRNNSLFYYITMIAKKNGLVITQELKDDGSFGIKIANEDIIASS